VQDSPSSAGSDQHEEQYNIDKGKDKEVINEQEDAAEDEFFDSHEYTPEEIEVPTQHSYTRYYLNVTNSLPAYRLKSGCFEKQTNTS
jgi:hypothetical protein